MGIQTSSFKHPIKSIVQITSVGVVRWPFLVLPSESDQAELNVSDALVFQLVGQSGDHWLHQLFEDDLVVLVLLHNYDHIGGLSWGLHAEAGAKVHWGLAVLAMYELGGCVDGNVLLTAGGDVGHGDGLLGFWDIGSHTVFAGLFVVGGVHEWEA